MLGLGKSSKTGPPWEFVLTLDEDPGFGASILLIPLEHQILDRLMCPTCSAHVWDKIAQTALIKHPALDWPHVPGGDRPTCKCRSCGYTAGVIFRFALA